jgi:hypothetical protein
MRNVELHRRPVVAVASPSLRDAIGKAPDDSPDPAQRCAPLRWAYSCGASVPLLG